MICEAQSPVDQRINPVIVNEEEPQSFLREKRRVRYEILSRHIGKMYFVKDPRVYIGIVGTSKYVVLVVHDALFI